MFTQVKRDRCELIILLIIAFKLLDSQCYEKTLRKIVRNQSKMVQRPFSENNALSLVNNSQLKQQLFTYPGFAVMKSVIHKMQRPKLSTILSSVDVGRSKTYSRTNVAKNYSIQPYELRLARNTFSNLTNALRHNDDNLFFPDLNTLEQADNYKTAEFSKNLINMIPTSRFFPIIQEMPAETQTTKQESTTSERSIVIPSNPDIKDDSRVHVKSIFTCKVDNTSKDIIDQKQTFSETDYDPDLERADFFIEEIPIPSQTYPYSHKTLPPYTCLFNCEAKADINAQEQFSKLNIEPSWIKSTKFWNHIYESRYESLMRNPNWPPLRVILVPRSHVDTLWRQPFEKLHNNSVRFIISNVIKKLQFYSNLTFTWNEVSHLSQWWKSASPKSRSAVRHLVKEGRLEITTGAWVETDEATSHLFGIVHQLMEGHQWLQRHLNYSPDVAWLTNSVSHGPTLPYLLSASGISNLVLTNLHFAWQQYLTEYQYTDFVWIQNWDNDKTTQTSLNVALNRIGNERLPRHSVLTHYLQFNSAGFKACGPQNDICKSEFNFANNDNHLDINTFNVKEKSEKLLEQYSKTGTTSVHNVVIAPIGGPFSYELQSEFDFQYNNYKKIADFVNVNKDVYKAKIEFGTPKDYFNTIFSRQILLPTLKGDFLNFADISDGSPAYWTGYFTSRPTFKILLKRLQATLRSTEILFSFALNYEALKKNEVSKLFVRLLNAREVVARLQDRNVVSGTLTAVALRYAYGQIAKTAQDCWYIQEVAASLLNSKPGRNTTYLEKYVYREGEFISSLKSIIPGDQIIIFNSLNHERTEVVELISRHHTIRILDHNKRDVILQIKPLWQYNSENVLKMSRQFFRIIFVAIIPPLAFEMFKIKNIYEAAQSTSTIYCTACEDEDDDDDAPMSPFKVQPIESGDIQLESYKHRLIFDEYTGFLKSVTEKSTNIEKQVSIEFGAFRSSHVNSGMFLFNTNISKPLEDILSPYRLNLNSKIVMIITGPIITEFITIYGHFIHHTIQIYNLMSSPLSNVLKLETKIDYEISPKHRELEVFMSIQTDIDNGNPPELFIDNNGFQYTPRTINISRRIESNVYPVTNMVFIQDQKRRLTIVTDHAQGVTALQEGQLVLMMDRRVLFDDGRGSNEGVADHSVAWHSHFILLESFSKPSNVNSNEMISQTSRTLPSLSAINLANTLNYNLDVFFIDINETRHCHYTFLPLLKTSFPCDVTVLNYRAVLNREYPSKYTSTSLLLTLHRQSFSCFIAHDSYMNCSRDSQFSIQKILRNARAVYQTNLVGTTEGVPVSILNKLNFPPMEITTLKIHF